MNNIENKILIRSMRDVFIDALRIKMKENNRIFLCLPILDRRH